MNAQAALARLQDVGFRYPGDSVDLFNDVTLDIWSGEVVMLVGPNGSGKSTLLGLLSGRLDSGVGQVRVLGIDPLRATRAPAVGFITEPFHPEQSPLPVYFTIRELLTWLQILDGVSHEDIEPLLDQLGLTSSLIGRRIDTLSKGERQRVMLLTVLLRRPRLILADEPLEGLDRTTRRLIGKCLRDYANDGIRSVLWVSHHVTETMQYADRLFEIEGCRLVERSMDRFALRVLNTDGQWRDVSVCSLAVLPGIVAEHLDGSRKLHLEITDTNAGEDME